jgi:uncharacterized glyoxalase superfamily protein PhnB
MTERSPIDRLNEVVDEVLGRSESAPVPPDPEMAPLRALAAALVGLPRESFRARLRAELVRRAERMTQAAVARYARPGFHSLTPYLLVPGASRLVDFMKQAFGAEEALRVDLPDGSIRHAEVRIGDSRVELADGLGGPWATRPAAIHLYVQDADETHARAVEAGATTLLPPTDMPYGDREADVKDPLGNNWYIATRKEGGPLPEGMRNVTPTLHAKGTDRLIDFIKDAFAAEEIERTLAPDGTVVHAQLRLGDSILELGEAHGPFPPMPASIHYYVEDVDAAYERALRAGATSLGAPSDRPYGDRAAEVADPFGNHWFLATHIGAGPAPAREGEGEGS